MTYEIDIPVDDFWGIGPWPDAYDHGPVVLFVPPGESERPRSEKEGFRFAACLDCGYVTDDIRRFLHTECDRSTNQINQTMRELIEDDGFPGD